VSDLSICVLLYGDHRDLATRCLGSITLSDVSEIQSKVQDIRVGLNDLSRENEAYVNLWAAKASKACRFPIITYKRKGSKKPVKYPMMRRMFYDPKRPMGRYLMWFDDDSYVVPRRDDPHLWWLETIEQLEAGTDVIGQWWDMPIQGSQWDWIRLQPWRDMSLPRPSKFSFPQGGWWSARTQFILLNNYPFRQLSHTGGDVMLGELCRHTKARTTDVTADYDSVRINADESGDHSTSPRRGVIKELPLGYASSDLKSNYSHQNFVVRVNVYRDGFLVEEGDLDAEHFKETPSGVAT
jgi:hypothetical protein